MAYPPQPPQASPPQPGPQARPVKKPNVPLLITAGVVACFVLCCGALFAFGDDDTNTADDTVQQTTAPPVAATTAAVTGLSTPSPTVLATVAMPKLIGKTASDAQAVLVQLGFTKIRILAEGGGNVELPALWTVAKQSVKVGTKISVTQTVTLTCFEDSDNDGVRDSTNDDSGDNAGDSGDDNGESAYYANCSAVRAAGAAPLHSGDPGYRRGLDRDGDGVACE